MNLIIGIVMTLLLGGFIGFLCSIIVLLKMRAFEMEETLASRERHLESITEALKAIEGANKISEECLRMTEELENGIRKES